MLPATCRPGALAGHVDEVAQLVPLRLQVAPIVGVGDGHKGHPLHDLEAVTFEPRPLGGVVGEQAYLLEPQVEEDLHPDAVVAAVGGEAERLVGLDGVEPLCLLESVGANLVAETDAAALLAHVHQDAAALLRYLLHRQLDLVAAVAAKGVKDIAGHALGVHPHEDGFRRGDVTHDEGGVLVGVDVGAVGVEAELPEAAGDGGLRHADDEAFPVRAVADELIDADDLETVTAGETLEPRHTHHGAVAVHQLADGGSGMQSGQLAEVDRGLGLAGAHQDAPLAGTQGVDVAGHDHIRRSRGGTGQYLDGARPVGGGDAGGNAVAGVHGDSEGGAELRLVQVLSDHHGNAQGIQALAGHGGADDAAGVLEHEGDGLRRDELSRDTQVALVLAVFVVNDDDGAAQAELLDGLLYGGQRRGGAPSGAAVILDGLYQGGPPPERSGPRPVRVPVLHISASRAALRATGRRSERLYRSPSLHYRQVSYELGWYAPACSARATR